MLGRRGFGGWRQHLIPCSQAFHVKNIPSLTLSFRGGFVRSMTTGFDVSFGLETSEPT